MIIYEQVGDKLVPAPQKNLPFRILKAIDNALHVGGISRNVRATFAEIARFVPQANPFEAVFAHKKKIAERTGASERTVYRHLQVLEDIGLIETLDQERKSRNGRFSVARIRLTKQAVDLLGFNPPTTSSISPSVKQEIGVIHTSPYDKMSAGHTLTEPTISKNQPSPKFQNGLPIELNWLLGQGLSKPGIFKLMALAKQNNHLLSDIVLVTKSYLNEKRGGMLYGYLAKLCTGKSNFSYAAQQERDRLVAAREAKILKEKAIRFRERFRGTAITNRSQTKLFVIDNNAKFAQVFTQRGCSTMPINNVKEFIDGIESGLLTLATLATENRLMGRNG